MSVITYCTTHSGSIAITSYLREVMYRSLISGLQNVWKWIAINNGVQFVNNSIHIWFSEHLAGLEIARIDVRKE